MFDKAKRFNYQPVQLKKKHFTKHRCKSYTEKQKTV